MPYCPKCGNHYYPNTRICSTCGETLSGQAEKRLDIDSEHKSVRKQEKDKRCPYCNSTGRVEGPVAGDVSVACPVCRGRRYNLIPEDWIWCKECNGSGEFIYGSGLASVRKPCPDCKGTGWVEI
jgi:DNA-directed RNA polymerase subunit M/transcription elongation factor TFIIS